MMQKIPVTIIAGFSGVINGCICFAIAGRFNPLSLLSILPPLLSLPPPLAPPREEERDKIANSDFRNSNEKPPSPLRGGIDGGGIGIKEGRSLCFNAQQALHEGVERRQISCIY